jgi:ATP-dependent Lhr-like helicase
VQTTAMILLLLEKWCEPPAARGAHFSTLVQQLLSAIAQRGGATISELFTLLCSSVSPFAGVTKGQFVDLVRHLGQKEFLTQESSGLLLHGRIGEKVVNHYTFYAAFGADEEFRVIAGGTVLGTLPVDQMMQVGQHVLFAGKTWRVEEIDEEGKAIHVKFSPGGNPPLFSGGAGRTHTRVRQKMRQVLEGSDIPPFLDDTARKLLQEGRRSYGDRELSKKIFIDCGPSFCLATWQGDSTNEAIACLFERRDIIATPSGPMIEIQKSQCSIEDAENVLHDAALEEMAPPDVLLAHAQNLQREKWDGVLPPNLLRESYARSHLDLENAKRWIDRFAASEILA